MAPDQGPEEQSALDEAIGFLDDTLDEGSVPVSTIKTESTKAGIAWTTMKRAKQKLGVTSQKLGGPGTPWCWTKKSKGTKPPIYGSLGPLSDSEAQKEAENPVNTELFKGDQGSLPKAGEGAIGPLTKDDDSESGWESF